jgi:hypothetical protein
MSMYQEQDLYKLLERIALALERLASSPVTGNVPSGPAPTPKPHKSAAEAPVEKPLKVQ